MMQQGRKGYKGRSSRSRSFSCLMCVNLEVQYKVCGFGKQLAGSFLLLLRIEFHFRGLSKEAEMVVGGM